MWNIFQSVQLLDNTTDHAYCCYPRRGRCSTCGLVKYLELLPQRHVEWMKPGSVSLQPALTATGRSQSAEKSPLSLLLHWQDLNPQSSSLHSIYDKYYHVIIQLLKKLKDIRFWPDVLSEIWATRITCQELKDIYTAFHKQKDYTKQANKQKRPPEKVLIKLCQERKLCLISMREKEKCLVKSIIIIIYYK